MRNFKKILALVLALTMVVGLMGVAVYADPVEGEGGTTEGGTTVTQNYTITVDNTSNQNVSISGKTYTAYKLFDASYSTPDEAATTYPGNVVDDAAHSYYMSTTSPFYTGTSYDATNATWTYGTYTNIIKDYFDFTVLPGDTTKVLVTPKKDTSGNSLFTEEKAYEMAQKLDPQLSTITGDKYVFTANGTGDETATIDVTAGGAGYYLVTGKGTSADGREVTAAVALTTTDPTATIKAKVTGTKLDKSIDEGEAAAVADDPTTTDKNEAKPAVKPGNGVKDESDPKEDTHAVGDTVPYVLTSAIPDMTGYEHFYFLVNDTLSKGLTFNNDVAIKIAYNGPQYIEHLKSTENASGSSTKYTITNEGTYYHRLADSTATPAVEEGYTTTAPTVETGKTPDDYADKYQVRNHQFVMYTDVETLGFTKNANTGIYEKTLTLGTDYTVTADTDSTTKETKVEIIFKDFYNKFNALTGATVTITYSATINGDAVIGVEGNPNTATLTYSNNPNDEGEGTPGNPDKPGENDSDIVGTTPEQQTKTYVTGIKIFKYEGADENPLAGAKFEFVGENLNKLVETNTEYYRVEEITSEEGVTPVTYETGATHYLLTDGTYTNVAPTYDTVVMDTTDTTKVASYTTGTWRKYVQTHWTSTPAATTYTLVDNTTVDLYTAQATDPWKAAYIKDNVKSWELTTGDDIKLTVTTDEEGIITITGLNEGWYVLTETEAPDGYNLLSSPYYIHVIPATKADGSLDVDNEGKLGWSAIAYTKDEVTITTETITVDGTEKTITKYEAKKDATGTTLNADTATSAWLSELKVENKSGTELPSTGGIGTTIFYIVGGLLAVGAGVVLVSKKRMGKVDD